jgi:ureidoacrylate peracid hydrolase
MAETGFDVQTLLTGHFAPEQTALVVVDVQNDFCAAGGFFDKVGHPLEMVHRAVDRLETVISEARAVGVTPIFIRAIYDEQYVSEAMRARHVRQDYPLDVCISDQWGSEFFQLRPEPNDIIVVKHRYSAFINTDLPLVLRSRGIKSLILGGVASNVCVESTARDGFMLDYHVMVLSDCSGTYSQELHDATMENIRRSFGVVATADELIGAWENLVAEPAR